MSLVELKDHAKNHKPKIKLYYIKKRHELIELLTMKELPKDLVLEKKKRSELIKEAKAKGYEKVWNLKKYELIELLYPSFEKNDKDNNHAQKHNDPEHGKSQ